MSTVSVAVMVPAFTTGTYRRYGRPSETMLCTFTVTCVLNASRRIVLIVCIQHKQARSFIRLAVKPGPHTCPRVAIPQSTLVAINRSAAITRFKTVYLLQYNEYPDLRAPEL